MEIINFAAWMAQQKQLTADQVDSLKDKLIIGKVVSDKRDGSQVRAYTMTVEDAKALFGVKELDFKLSDRGLVPIPESPVGIDIISNTSGLNIVSTNKPGIGTYQIVFDKPIFADMSKVSILQGPQDKRMIYNVGFYVPESSGNDLDMWLWSTSDDYTLLIRSSFQQGLNTPFSINRDLEHNFTLLPITLRIS